MDNRIMASREVNKCRLYVKPRIEISQISTNDIITVSGVSGPIQEKSGDTIGNDIFSITSPEIL